MTNRTSGFFAKLLAGLIFFAVGILFTYLTTWPNYQNAKESLGWAEAPGIITSAKLRSRTDSENKTLYNAAVAYTYSVKGRNYRSTAVYIGSKTFWSSNRQKASNTINKYRPKTKVTVYYDQKNHQNAVLEPGPKTMHYIFLGASCAFILVGIILLFSTLFSGLKIALFTFLATLGLVSMWKQKKSRKKSKEDDYTAVEKKYHPHTTHDKRAPEKPENAGAFIDLDDEVAQFNEVAASSSNKQKK